MRKRVRENLFKLKCYVFNLRTNKNNFIYYLCTFQTNCKAVDMKSSSKTNCPVELFQTES